MSDNTPTTTNFEDLKDTNIGEIISHFNGTEDHKVIISIEHKEYEVTLGSNENGEYEIVTDENPPKRLKTLYDIFRHLGIKKTPEYQRIYISIDACWKLY